MKTEEIGYTKLIDSWYRKAVVDDYFSKFIFLDLAFIALLRKKYFVFSKQDRDAIESLKKAEKIKKEYLEVLKKQRPLEAEFEALIRELNKKPLENVSWNNREPTELKIKDKEDWNNLIEFIYIVRNNLFHGEKNTESFRDSMMVYYAYTLLKPLVELLISYEPHYLGIDDQGIKQVREKMKNLEDKNM